MTDVMFEPTQTDKPNQGTQTQACMGVCVYSKLSDMSGRLRQARGMHVCNACVFLAEL